jgi:hypothetical protein
LMTFVRTHQLSHFWPILKSWHGWFCEFPQDGCCKELIFTPSKCTKWRQNHHISILSKSYTLQCNYLYNHCMHVRKKKATNILCLCSFIVCNRNKKNKRKEKPEQNQKKKTKNKLNPLTCQSHIFYIWTLQLDPKPLDTHCSLGKNVFLKVKKLPIQGSICFKLVPGPLSKATVILAG